MKQIDHDTFLETSKESLLVYGPSRRFDLLPGLRQALENILGRLRFTKLRCRVTHSELTNHCPIKTTL